MTKSILPNFKKWTIDERRLFVISLLTLIYPVFVTSFFALYLFVLMPAILSPSTSLKEAHQAGWYHYYWLFASILWIILCAPVILFKKKNVQHEMNLANVERSLHTQPIIKVEERDEEGSQTNLSQKSNNSSNNMKKAISDLESEKESLLQSRESLRQSSTFLDGKKLTQSGEFLNDCMSTIHSEDVENNETVCEIHAEEIKEADNGKIKNYEQEREMMDEQDHLLEKEDSEDETRNNKKDERTSVMKDVNIKELSNENKEGSLNSDNSSECSGSNEEIEPFISPEKAIHPQTSSPLKVNKAVVEQHEDAGELESTEEVDKLDSNFPVVKREKGILSIDTSRTSGYYECSMPTPKSVESQGSKNNTVFLFINPESADTEDSILVSHGGKVEDSTNEETEP